MQNSPDIIPDRPCPAKLFLEVTTRCNLHCKMCVKQSSGNGIETGDLTDATFEALLPSVAGLEEVIISGVGEPLLHPRLDDFILDIKKTMPSSGSVGLQTNGTLLNQERIEGLLSVDLDTICISVDSISPDLLRRMRAGAQIEQLEAALGLLHRAKSRRFCSGPAVGIQFVLMQDNLYHLPEVLKWAGRLGVDFAIVSHLLPFEPAISPQAAYPASSDAAIDFFYKWRQVISRSGLRIEDYPQASVKYYKCRTADEKRLIELVDAMKSEADLNGLTLDLTGLISLPTKGPEPVEDLFEEAMSVACSEGLDLILPARRPAHARRCSFIEEGAVFLAWDGSVSPCHFTWHRYACYPQGRRKIVQPVSFGCVQSMSLIDIWNNPEFKSFRKGVLGYDYPYCGDCGLAPCDYIEGPEFEQDCHTNRVPCCDCPWPTGVLNCLQ